MTVASYRQKNRSLVVHFNDQGPGAVYVMRSKWIPGLTKIGAAHAGDAHARVKNCSVPDPEIVGLWREDRPWSLERRLHAWFDEYRVPNTKEWYEVDPFLVVEVVTSWRIFHSEMGVGMDPRVFGPPPLELESVRVGRSVSLRHLRVGNGEAVPPVRAG